MKSKCHSGYVKNKSTGKCVYKTGTVGRSLSKKRASKKKSHKRSGRPSPQTSATLYNVGQIRIGHDKKQWIVKKTTKGVKRWVRLIKTF